MAKVLSSGHEAKWVGIPVTLLGSVSEKYTWERYESLYPSIYGLNSITYVHP